MGPNGKIVEEKYFDNNAVARGVNGHTVIDLLICLGKREIARL